MIKTKVFGSMNPEIAKAILSQVYAEKLFLAYDIKVGKKTGNSLAMSCTSLCEKPLHRVHSRCLTCGARKAYYGLNQPVQVTAHVVYEPNNLAFWRRKLARISRSFHSFITGV